MLAITLTAPPQSDGMDESAGFIRKIGMRPIFEGSPVSVYEMHGGTHLHFKPRFWQAHLNPQ